MKITEREIEKFLKEDIKTKDISKVKSPKDLAVFMKNYSDTLNQVNPQLSQKVNSVLPKQTAAKIEPEVSKASEFIKSIDGATRDLQTNLNQIQKDWERNNTTWGKIKGGVSDFGDKVKTGIQHGLTGLKNYKPKPNMYSDEPSDKPDKQDGNWLDNRLSNQGDDPGEFLKSLSKNKDDVPNVSDNPTDLAKDLGKIDPADAEINKFLSGQSSSEPEKDKPKGDVDTKEPQISSEPEKSEPNKTSGPEKNPDGLGAADKKARDAALVAQKTKDQLAGKAPVKPTDLPTGEKPSLSSLYKDKPKGEAPPPFSGGGQEGEEPKDDKGINKFGARHLPNDRDLSAGSRKARRAAATGYKTAYSK